MQLRLMRDEVARGSGPPTRPGRCACCSTRRGEGLLIQELLAGSQRMEPAAIQAALDQAHDELGLAVCVDHVLMPAMRQIGGLVGDRPLRCRPGAPHHRGGAGVVGPDHRPRSRPSHDRPVLLACGPRDLHTLGLEALAGLLAYQGPRVSAPGCPYAGADPGHRGHRHGRGRGGRRLAPRHPAPTGGRSAPCRSRRTAPRCSTPATRSFSRRSQQCPARISGTAWPPRPT